MPPHSIQNTTDKIMSQPLRLPSGSFAVWLHPAFLAYLLSPATRRPKLRPPQAAVVSPLNSESLLRTFFLLGMLLFLPLEILPSVSCSARSFEMPSL